MTDPTPGQGGLDRGRAPAVPPQAPTAPLPRLGRSPVLDVAPVLAHGNAAATSVMREEFDVTATVLAEGHDAVNATVLPTDLHGSERVEPLALSTRGIP